MRSAAARSVLFTLGCLACAGAAPEPLPHPADDDAMTTERHSMVERQIVARGIRDERVLDAMRRVPRHRFVPEPQSGSAYVDSPLAIGGGQTISQPYIVALMTESIAPRPGMRVLEIGTGSGYQAAVLAEIVDRVYTIEIVPELGRRAAGLIEELGYDNVETRIGDGYAGWPEAAPFDGILVTAAPEEIPAPLLDQIADGGRLVIPVGRGVQELVVVERHGDRLDRHNVAPVRFVPMTGRARSTP